VSALVTVLRKELLDALRDRRTLVTGLVVMPLALPLLFGGISAFGARAQAEKLEAPLRLPVAGAERAPNLAAFLREGGVEVVADDDPERLVRGREADLALRVDPAYADRWRASEPAPVELLYDASRPVESGASVARVRGLLEAYGEQVGALRLLARGVHPAVAKPLRVADRDLAPLGAKFAVGKLLVPYLLMLYGFIGGMQIATDATAGERERQTLEPLLATPASREAILSGKVLATAAFSQLTLVAMLASYELVFWALPLGPGGASFDLAASALPRVWLAVTPVTLLGAAVLTSLAAFAKSPREAQTYLPLLMFLPMVPSLVLMVAPIKTKLWMAAVPFFGPNLLLIKILRDEAVASAEWALCLGSGLALAAAVWALAARLYHRESLTVSSLRPAPRPPARRAARRSPPSTAPHAPARPSRRPPRRAAPAKAARDGKPQRGYS
jgi:sodium transport system permease protein